MAKSKAATPKPPVKGGPFSPENIKKALARVPATATRQLRNMQAKAEELGLEELATACAAELKGRPIEADADTAERQAQLAAHCVEMPLTARIEKAFDTFPPSKAELRMVRAIAGQPGISYSELVKMHGKGDVGLVLGHFVYDRYGAFQADIADGGAKSDVLFERKDSAGGKTYALRPEAQAAFSTLGVI